jgi:hypothetical protein
MCALTNTPHAHTPTHHVSPRHAKVCAADGITYERSAIEEWFARSPAGNATSPLTGEPLASTTLYPSVVVRSMTQKMQRRMRGD